LYQKWKLKFDRKKSENEENLQIEAIQKRILVIYFYENWKHGKERRGIGKRWKEVIFFSFL
jgi:hypothetical protein